MKQLMKLVKIRAEVDVRCARELLLVANGEFNNCGWLATSDQWPVALNAI